MHPVTRRAVFALLAGLVGKGAAAAVPASGALLFKALRNDKPLGTHALAFTRVGASLSVRSTVDYRVSFGPIPLFRYHMAVEETWQNDVLVRLQGQTDDNGHQDFVTATRDGERLVVDGSKSGRYVAPAGAIAATHWNRHELDAPMINPQDGELMDYTVRAAGSGRVALADGGTLTARRFALSGPAMLDLWYDEAGVWAGLQAAAKDGSMIVYQRE
jgi:hypothetical protein